jgi:hypothetical protein
VSPSRDQAVGLGARLGEIPAVQDDAGPEPLAGRDLDQGRELRHHHGHRDPEEPAVVGEPEGVVPAEAATTPFGGSPGSIRSALRAPLSLNEPVRWKLSSLQTIRAPVISLSGIDPGTASR